MKELLSLGSIVILKEGTKKLMVVGYLPVTKEKQMYDYSGCIWPEGVLTSDSAILFNHDQIKEVISKGYVDDEQKEFNTKLEELYKRNNRNINSNEE